jgi:hypothetical protein
MSRARRRDFVLAVFPFRVGLAYALFESPLSPVEWGVKDIRGKQKNALTLDAAKQLIERLQPDVLVLQEFSGPRTRAPRLRRLQRLIEGHAEAQALEVHTYSRQKIRDAFRPLGAASRYEIAQVIASQIHAFRHRLPPPRKIWKTEAPRMGLFDAVSLAMTFYAQSGEKLVPDDDP